MRSYIFIFFMIPHILLSQIHDDFSDGNFSYNPQWAGDTAEFEVDTLKQLHLIAPEKTDTSSLSTPSQSISEGTWEFFVRFDFNPSSSNFCKVYLVSDKADVQSPLNGYFVRLGYTTDEISLFRQTGAVEQKIIDGADGRLNSDTVTVRVRITRDSAGNWNLFSDTTGGYGFIFEGSGFDNTFFSSTFFGITCRYTTTRHDKFFFDDIFVTGDPFTDSVKPIIKKISVTGEKTLELQFSESVDSVSAQTIFNYLVDHSVGNPFSAFQLPTDRRIITLSFSVEFKNKQINTLIVSNVLDLYGNIMDTVRIDFCYYVISAGDVIISEIMADPYPVVAMPDYEYVELFNRSPYDLDLAGWFFIADNERASIPVLHIPADGYVILCEQENISLFEKYGPVAGIDNMPALYNSGRILSLRDNRGVVISSVTYSDNWYADIIKEEGGWSLEMIDTDNPCGGAENWKASVDPAGGTPGRNNSVSGENPDLILPEIQKVIVLSDSSLQVVFSEPVDTVVVADPFSWIVDHNIGVPFAADPSEPAYCSVVLHFTAAFHPRTIYTLTANAEINDCTGNKLTENNSCRFAMPELPVAQDIVINEVLFNPQDDGEDFVELYNRSEKTIDMENLMLATWNEETQQIGSLTKVSDEPRLMFPGEYMVLTPNPEKVKKQYYTSNPDGFVTVTGMPYFNNDKGRVIITAKDMKLIDDFFYQEDMHFALLTDVEGVSLERLAVNGKTNDPENWHSAAATAGFATPAYKNSQSIDNLNCKEEITIEPEVFSPDNDGYHDVLTVRYALQTPGYVANIYVYDASGRLVIHLINNMLLETNGCLIWDGIDRFGKKASIGIYILYIELFDLNGNLKKYKKTCVIASKCIK